MNENSTQSFFKNQKGTWDTSSGDFHNRGFLFSDGLFETMVFKNGNIRFSVNHHSRMLTGCQTLQMDYSQLSQIDAIEGFLRRQYQDTPKRVRWNVYRGGQGKYTPEQNGILESIQVTALSKAVPVKQNAAFSDSVQVPSVFWSHCKTISGLHYVMANLERSKRSLDEIILMNDKGYVSEAGSSNIFWEKDGVFYTPSLEASCIAGISRKVILEKMILSGMTIKEGLFQKEALMLADRVFTSNVTGISMIANIEGSAFDISGLPSEIYSLFE